MKDEKTIRKRNEMIVLDVKLDNFYAFRNFHMNLTYPKKIIGSRIVNEHLENYPNFRYKKVNIIMGANATGKTSYGRMLMNIFNFIDKKNYSKITDAISNKEKDAFFTIDLICKSNTLYRIECRVTPGQNEKYSPDNIDLHVKSMGITAKDSYESCVKRLEASEQPKNNSYIDELEKIEELYWMFEYPEDIGRRLRLPSDDEMFLRVLENILKALDPSIQKVEKVKEVDNAYAIRLCNRAIVIQDGEPFSTELLSSGTKAGVEVARVVSALLQGFNSFYYCDEKFSYIHSDIEKAILSVMIDSIRPNEQLFFTTHNTDILEMDLPKHAFTFLKKNMNDAEHVITCFSAADFLKRNTDSLKNAVDNDLFSMAPATDLIYDIADF